MAVAVECHASLSACSGLRVKQKTCRNFQVKVKVFMTPLSITCSRIVDVVSVVAWELRPAHKMNLLTFRLRIAEITSYGMLA